MIYTVTQVNSYIKNMFAQDYALRRICVKGEVSNCKYHSSGHIYFTLKDSGGTLSAVMFASRRSGLSFALKDGMQVEVTGSVDVYERGGSYQLYAQSIKQAGLGDLYEKYLKLKEQLEETGLFAEEYKQPIPRHAKVIGIATASTGAAVQDIINVTTRRNPYIQLVFSPTQVQGDGAAESIVRSIKALDAYGCDVLIVGRGGGSIEDLWAFNEEAVARAIFNAKTPIISAVGHETDFTIADFVADLRAPTPSAAAEIATEDIREFEEGLAGRVNYLSVLMHRKLENVKQELREAELRLAKEAPQSKVNEFRMLTEEARMRLSHAILQQLTGTRHLFEVRCEKLKGLSPLEKISSGYAWVSGDDGRHIRKAEELKSGDEVHIRFSDGEREATIR